ncbi:mechanosensitive ion channel-like protein [Ulvibacter sp. MAR_2010_11]|uniref:mechanosensitive ion channel family protein n=1 Tax=Ulvibacter sp. MAR_2010_11 TaxID=1250229 RepID=UPI000C2C89B1|nr:mechanosensitive ion channel domain-containing protein [Ulvibacter sp. MAR_2010_11]PKA84502.1 mechanosensitive ion channel-like protein [Ulvibacter sp. MAR_2010_11]
MDYFEFIKEWFNTHPTTTSIIKYIIWLLFVVGGIQFLRRYFKKSIADTSARYKTQKAIEIGGYLLIILLTISYFTGNIKDFTLAIGLFSAGIAITLQELFLSLAGSIYIFLVKVYAPGDRIEMNGIKGDVIDIDSIYTTMMEIGEWVSSDNYSGRIVKLSNAFVFKGPIYNYTQDFPFIWDELNIPIRYGSDTELAKKIIVSVASEILSEYTLASKKQWEGVVNKFYIEDAIVEPTLAITLTDNWLKFNLRYIVNYQKRRMTQHLLHDTIHTKINETNGKVVLASATIEVIRIPELKVGKDLK